MEVSQLGLTHDIPAPLLSTAALSSFLALHRMLRTLLVAPPLPGCSVLRALNLLPHSAPPKLVCSKLALLAAAGVQH